MEADGSHIDVEQTLAGLDGPRPVPDAVRDRVADAVQLAAGTLPAGLDGPRPVPPAVAARIAAALGIGRGAAARLRRLRLGAAAAVALVVMGVAAATTRPVDPDGGEVAADAAGRDEPPARAPRPRARASTTSTSVPASTTTTTGGGATVVALDESDPAYARLDRFASCDELLGWVRERAAAEVTEWGFEPYLVAGPAAGGDGPPVAGGPMGPESGAAGGDTSGTNVQEPGVDEPDLVETDGRALYVSVDGRAVHAVSAGQAPRVLSSTAIGTDQRHVNGLVLDGDRLAVLTSTYADGRAATEVWILGVGDPSAPVNLGGVALSGAYVEARATQHALHVVTRSWPGPFAFTSPRDDSAAERERAREANRRTVMDSTLEQWVPPSVPCESVHRPRELSGFEATTVWTVPFADPAAATSTALMADAQLVYATADRLVVATTEWRDVERPEDPSAPPPDGVRTQLHRFALAPGGAEYLASGSVPGYVRSSYGISERGGYLRVASTEAPPWWSADRPSSSTVTVLAQDGEALVPVGAVGGLGENEHIQGVRFVDDIAFVVTFRQTDPLYVVDLGDPTAPRLRGELHVTGFSGYLHPVGPGRLLGVGVEADESGARTAGAVSMYDVSDLDRPTLAQRVQDPDADYLATFDPHAFLLWEPTGMLVLPAAVYERDAAALSAPVRGAADVFTVAGGTISTRGRITHGEHDASSMVVRAVYANGVLFTVGTGGVLASDPATLSTTGWAGF